MWRAAIPMLNTDFNFVDAITMWFVKNPEWFDVVVAPNMFGDIITDLGAMIQGGLGLAPGANLNPEGTSMFEPIHGSAPKYKGQNKVNPIATIWAGALLLEHLGQAEAAKDIVSAIERNLFEGKNKDVRPGRKLNHLRGGLGDSPPSGTCLSPTREKALCGIPLFLTQCSILGLRHARP